MNSWFSYLFCGALALTLSLITTGCRFGNRVQEKPSSDTLTGFYETIPAAAEACAKYVPQGSETLDGEAKCLPVSTDQIPSAFKAELDARLTNPVIFQLKKDSTDTGYIYSPYDTGSSPPFFKFKYDSALNLNMPMPYGEEVKLSETCTDLDIWYVGDGKLELSSTGPYKKAFNSTTVQIQGRVNLVMTAGHIFDGDCASALQSLTDCLKNSAACNRPEDYALAQKIFGYYLTQQLMTVDNIPTLQQLAVSILYE